MEYKIYRPVAKESLDDAGFDISSYAEHLFDTALLAPDYRRTGPVDVEVARQVVPAYDDDGFEIPEIAMLIIKAEVENA